MSDAAALARAVRSRSRQLERQAGEAAALAREGIEAQARAKALERRLEMHDKCVALLTQVGEQAQEDARAQVEGLVTQALRAVFGDAHSFHLQAGERSGQATLTLVIRTMQDGRPLDTPVLEAHGGGLAQLVGFVLRLVILLLTPSARPLLALDEPFGMVSERYEPLVAQFLREVVDKTGVQVLMVTHSRVYGEHADVCLRVALGPDAIARIDAAGTD